jgi:hypothetical protein
MNMTDQQYKLVELLLIAATCDDAEAPAAMEEAENYAVSLSAEEILMAQAAMLRIIRRNPD